MEAAKLLRQFLGDVPEEHFVLMVLDSRRRVIGISEVSVGTLSASLVIPLADHIVIGEGESFFAHLHEASIEIASGVWISIRVGG